MKPQFPKTLAAGVLTLGLLAAFAGCANVPLRQSTLESRYSPALATDARLTPPTPIRTVEPFYPIDMRRAGITGMVKVTCLVSATGQVQDPTAEYASHDAFIPPAIEAVQRWTFKPGERDGVPVAVRVSLPVNFTLVD
jgi:protein TonB